jgi:hypothetical protein
MSESLAGLTFKPAATKRVLFAKLRKAQDPNGKTSVGEKFAMVVLSKTKAELRDWLDELERDHETGELVVETIVRASESLKTRLQLVDSAFARLCVVADDQAGSRLHV